VTTHAERATWPEQERGECAAEGTEGHTSTYVPRAAGRLFMFWPDPPEGLPRQWSSAVPREQRNGCPFTLVGKHTRGGQWVQLTTSYFHNNRGSCGRVRRDGRSSSDVEDDAGCWKNR